MQSNVLVIGQFIFCLLTFSPDYCWASCLTGDHLNLDERSWTNFYV